MNHDNLMLEPTEGAFQLGDWLVEPSLNRLSRGDRVVQLELRLIELLVFLARRPGVVVGKREIIDGVWRTEFVAENTLTHSIADLRRALGDDARNPRFIETIPKRGYRIVAPVRMQHDSPPEPSSTAAELMLISSDREYLLHQGENLIGRAPTADVCIDSARVSRRHARILIDGDRAILEDLGSKNGTYAWNEPLQGPVDLVSGDEIRFGGHRPSFRFVADDDRTLTATASVMD